MMWDVCPQPPPPWLYVTASLPDLYDGYRLVTVDNLRVTLHYFMSVLNLTN